MEKVALHPEFITRKNRREFAVLPYAEFLALQELLNDYLDLRDLRKAKQREGKAKGLPLSEARKLLNI